MTRDRDGLDTERAAALDRLAAARSYYAAAHDVVLALKHPDDQDDDHDDLEETDL